MKVESGLGQLRSDGRSSQGLMRLLILKTGALGDVLRSTSILPGLSEAHGDLDVTWVTAPAAEALVVSHPLVQRVLCVDPGDRRAVADLGESLQGESWDWVLSFDDEEPLCRLASSLKTIKLSGAYLTKAGDRAYTDDVAPWFEMGLLSRDGKDEADRLKVQNQRSHPQIFASMLGIEMGAPEFPLPDKALTAAASFAADSSLRRGGIVIGLNTGAGGRWRTKAMAEDQVLGLAARLHAALDGHVTFLMLGGPDELERNERLGAGLAAAGQSVVHAGSANSLADFAARLSLCDLLVVSDSLALHIALARKVPMVSFFAPTSAAEIELYGLGEKVLSTAPDYCSYRPDADNSTITAERVADAAIRVLAAKNLASQP